MAVISFRTSWRRASCIPRFSRRRVLLQFAPELLTEGENALPSYIDFAEELDQIVFVCEEKPGEINLYYDMATEHLLVTRKGTGGNA